MHPRIGSPGDDDRDRALGHLAQRCLNNTLYTILMQLALPATEPVAIVFKAQCPAGASRLCQLLHRQAGLKAFQQLPGFFLMGTTVFPNQFFEQIACRFTVTHLHIGLG